MSPGQLEADVDRYRQAAAANTPPPQIPSDPLVGGQTPIEQLLRVLGLAANLGDEQDNAENSDEHGERDARTTEAANEFAAQDQDAAAQMAQQIPQLASGIAGALGGAVSGVMQPIAQLPQQLSQGAQQAMQAGMGLLQAGDATAGYSETDLDLGDAGLGDIGLGDAGAGGTDEFGGGGGGFEGAGSAGGGGGVPAAAMPGPPAPPSAPTFASSVRSGPAAGQVASGHAAGPGGAMAGVPMVPPTALNGAGAADKESKTETKRVSAPAVRNGAPVQGRISTPPAGTAGAPASDVQGKPVASRRIIVTRDDAAAAGNRAGPP